MIRPRRTRVFPANEMQHQPQDSNDAQRCGQNSPPRPFRKQADGQGDQNQEENDEEDGGFFADVEWRLLGSVWINISKEACSLGRIDYMETSDYRLAFEIDNPRIYRVRESRGYPFILRSV